MSKILSIPLMMLSLVACSATARQPDPPITLSGTKEVPLGASLAGVVDEFALEEPFYLNDASCGTTSFNYPPLNLSILAIDGRVSRLSYSAEFENIPETSYVTPEGIRLGSTVEEIHRAFPKAEHSVDLNSGYLKFIAWQSRGKSGWLFEVSPETQRVISVSVGDESIEFYEDCA